MSVRPRQVLFVCSGNLCRSPMAEAFARAHAERLDLDLEVSSAGTLGIEGRPADPKVVAVCRERGLDLSGHRSQGLTPELVAAADQILVMELAHALFVRELAPELPEGKVALLGSWGPGGEIADPIGSWFKRPFRDARDEIERCVVSWLQTARRST